MIIEEKDITLTTEDPLLLINNDEICLQYEYVFEDNTTHQFYVCSNDPNGQAYININIDTRIQNNVIDKSACFKIRILPIPQMSEPEKILILKEVNVSIKNKLSNISIAQVTINIDNEYFLLVSNETINTFKYYVVFCLYITYISNTAFIQNVSIRGVYEKLKEVNIDKFSADFRSKYKNIHTKKQYTCNLSYLLNNSPLARSKQIVNNTLVNKGVYVTEQKKNVYVRDILYEDRDAVVTNLAMNNNALSYRISMESGLGYSLAALSDKVLVKSRSGEVVMFSRTQDWYFSSGYYGYYPISIYSIDINEKSGCNPTSITSYQRLLTPNLLLVEQKTNNIFNIKYLDYRTDNDIRFSSISSSSLNVQNSVFSNSNTTIYPIDYNKLLFLSESGNLVSKIVLAIKSDRNLNVASYDTAITTNDCLGYGGNFVFLQVSNTVVAANTHSLLAIAYYRDMQSLIDVKKKLLV